MQNDLSDTVLKADDEHQQVRPQPSEEEKVNISNESDVDEDPDMILVPSG